MLQPSYGKGGIKMLFKLVKVDIYHGIWKRNKILVLIFVVAIAINVIYASITYELITNAGLLQQNEVSSADYILYYIHGMKEYDPEVDQSFLFPALWMFNILTCCFLCLHYPLEDLEKSGKHRLILSQNRREWWLSKCIWSCSMVSIYYLIEYFISFIFAWIRGAKLSVYASSYTKLVMGYGSGKTLEGPYNLLPFMGLIPLVVMGLCLLQLAISLVIRPIYSYLVVVTILLASAYYSTPFLIGNFAMPVRSQLFQEEGLSLFSGVMAAIGLGIVSSILGMLIFQKKDIL